MKKNRFRAVLDTNVVLAAHLSESQDSPNKEIINRWENDEFDVLWTIDVLSEYINKLKEFDISEEEIVKLVSLFIMIGKEVEVKFYHYEYYPEDAKDICFVLCALNGDGTHIVSYDPHLLNLKENYRLEFGIQVVKPLEYLIELRTILYQ